MSVQEKGVDMQQMCVAEAWKLLSKLIVTPQFFLIGSDNIRH